MLNRENSQSEFLEGYFCLRQRSLQYLTSSQHFPHFLRHENGFPQTTQSLLGKKDLFPL